MSAAFSPLPEASTADVVAQRLRDAILDGSLRPGDRLVEHDLAARFQVSRGPVREAIRLLVPDGLVVLRRNRGAIVASPTFDDVLEVYAVRMSLGSLALAQAVYVDAAAHPEFGGLLILLQRLSDPEVQADALLMMEADLLFQDALLATSGLPRITSILDQSARDVAFFVRMLGISYDSSDHAALIQRHERVIEAVRECDPEAATDAWQTHIRHTVGEFARRYPDADISGVFSHPLTEQLFDGPIGEDS